MKNLPAAIFVIRCLIWETVRQSLATRTFWLALAISSLTILFCLSIRISGGESLQQPEEIELIGQAGTPYQGINPSQGYLQIGFGYGPRLWLFRDAKAQVHFLQTILAKWVAGALGTILFLIWTAGFLPEFLQPQAAAVLIAKPVPRWSLLVGKYLGVCFFVAFQAAFFVVGTWAALGWATQIWLPGYLLCLPLLLLNFAVFYSFSALLATVTRSAVACTFGSILFWLVCFSVNYGRHSLVAEGAREPDYRLAAGGPVSSLAVSPDGKLLAASGPGGSVQLLELATGKQRSELHGHTGDIRAIAFTPNGLSIVTAGSDGTIRTWDASTGKALRVLNGHQTGVAAIALGSDRRLASGGLDGTILLWNLQTGKLAGKVQGPKAPVNALMFSLDGRRLLAGTGDGQGILWSLAKLTSEVSLNHAAPIHWVGFSADGRYAVTGGANGTVKLWDLLLTTPEGLLRPEAEHFQNRITLQHGGPMTAMTFARDGRSLATCSADGVVRVWDVFQGKIRLSFPPAGAEIVSIAFTPDGQKLLCGTRDGTIQIKETNLGRLRGGLIERKELAGKYLSLAFSPDGKWLATGSPRGFVQIWDSSSGRMRHVMQGHKGAVVSVTYSPDNKWIASASDDGAVKVWDAKTGQAHASFAGHTGLAQCVAFAPSGKLLASGGGDGFVKLWDLGQETLHATLSAHQGGVGSLAWAPDGQTLASGGADHSIRLWNPSSGEQRATLGGHAGAVLALLFSADSRLLISAGEDKDIRIWDPANETEQAALRGHAGSVSALALALDGQTLFSASADGTIQLWDAQAKSRAVLHAHEGPVRALALSPDGKMFASCGDENNVKLWDMPAELSIAPSHSSLYTFAVQGSYWLLPKPGDLTIILDQMINAKDHFGKMPEFEKVERTGHFHPELSLLTALLFTIVTLFLASYQFAYTEY